MVIPWLRLIRISLSLIGKPRVDLLAATRVRIRIWPNDLDTNVHVNNGRYLTLADLGRMHWFVRTGVYATAKREGVFPVVGDAFAKYRRELRLFQQVQIETRLVGWSGRWGFLEHRFIRHGRVVAMVGVRGAFTGRNGTIDSWEFLSQLNQTGGSGVAVASTPASPPLPAWTRAFQESAEAVSTMLRGEEKEARGEQGRNSEADS
jgi:acyl-CoA thioesterase FadM